MDTQLFSTVYDLQSINNAAENFWEKLKHYRLFTWEAEMGAGKTTFIHALCDILKVNDPVSSPTFSLINEYHFFDLGTEKKIYHMDWYRIKDETEAIQAGLEDALNDRDAICFIEWSQNAPGIITGSHLQIQLDVIDVVTRRISAMVVD